jgi:predicted RND superfamily exporter protein
MTESARSTFYDRYYGWILLVFALSIVPIVMGVIKSEETNNNNIKQWLPKDLDETKVYEEFRKHFGTDEYAIVSWKGCTLDDPRLAHFAELVREYRNDDNKRLFEKVVTGPELLAKLQAKPFDLSEKVARDRLKSIIIGQNGKASAAIIELTEEGDDDRRTAIEALDNILQQKLQIPVGEIHMAGDAVTNAAVDVESRRATDSLVGYSMLIAVACAIVSFFFAYGRSSRRWFSGLLYSLVLALIIFIVAYYCALLAQSLVPLFGGRVNLVLVVMPVLIYVLSLSAGVHLVNYYQDAIRESGTWQAPLASIQRGWLPCTLAAGTTAIGLASLSVSKIIPVKDFGKYSAIGIVGSLAVLFLLLPALLVLIQKLSQKNAEQTAVQRRGASTPHCFDRFVQWIAKNIIQHYRATSLVCLTILIFFGWGAFYINTSVKPARFFDQNHRLITDYQWLATAERFGNQIPLEIVVEFDLNNSTLRKWRNWQTR